MSNPPGPPHGDPSQWARPADPTTPMPVDSSRQDGPTQRIPGPPIAPPGYPPAPPVSPPPAPPPSSTAPPPGPARGSFLRDPLALVLVAITVVALALAGLIGTELYARHIADGKVAAATECVVHDRASVSFGATPPFLWQHITGNYTNISVETAGNQIKEAKDMKAELNIFDVRLHSEGDSGGTIGALDATLTWSANGIRDTIQDMIPLLGKVVAEVNTNASDGTVELKGAFGLASITVKPQVVNGGLSLQVLNLTGLGSMALPRETLQPTLDDFANQLTKKYPLGIHADSLQVTDSGVVAHFSTRNATIPSHSKDPCFANL